MSETKRGEYDALVAEQKRKLLNPEEYVGWIRQTIEGHVPVEREVLYDAMKKLEVVQGCYGLEEHQVATKALLAAYKKDYSDRVLEEVTELNLAMRVYGDDLPKFYVRLIEETEFKAVDGFGISEDEEIFPIVDGQICMSRIKEVTMIGGESGSGYEYDD